MTVRGSLVCAVVLVLAMCATASVGDVTHIFFGKFYKEYVKDGDPVEAGEYSWLITGDRVHNTYVTVTGKECRQWYWGLELSWKPDVLGALGHDGYINITYPQGVGAMEVVFVDESADLPLVDGADVKMWAQSSAGFGQGIQILDVQLGIGDQKHLRGKWARQVFQPSVHDGGASERTQISLHAYGYDHFTIARVSIYSDPKAIRTNITFLDRAKGGRSKALSWSVSDERKKLEEFVRFKDWMADKRRSRYTYND